MTRPMLQGFCCLVAASDLGKNFIITLESKAKIPALSFFRILADPLSGKNRSEDFASELRQVNNQKYLHHYEPEEILGYIYAVLHRPAYRRRYALFLKIYFLYLSLVS